MAWIFSLSAECGSDESNANKFAEHFDWSLEKIEAKNG